VELFEWVLVAFAAIGSAAAAVAAWRQFTRDSELATRVTLIEERLLLYVTKDHASRLHQDRTLEIRNLEVRIEKLEDDEDDDDKGDK